MITVVLIRQVENLPLAVPKVKKLAKESKLVSSSKKDSIVIIFKLIKQKLEVKQLRK